MAQCARARQIPVKALNDSALTKIRFILSKGPAFVCSFVIKKIENAQKW